MTYDQVLKLKYSLAQELGSNSLGFKMLDMAICGYMTLEQQANFLNDVQNRGLMGMPKNLDKIDCGWYIGQALNEMSNIAIKGHHNFSGFSLLKSKSEHDIRTLFDGYEVVEARIHLFEKDDFVVEHIDNAYGDATAYICRLDCIGPSRFYVHGEIVEEKQGEWRSIPVGVKHEVKTGDTSRVSMVVWANKI